MIKVGSVIRHSDGATNFTVEDASPTFVMLHGTGENGKPQTIFTSRDAIERLIAKGKVQVVKGSDDD